MSCSWMCDASWQTLPVASELAGAPTAVGVAHNVVIETNIPVLLGRFQLVYDQTAGLVVLNQDGLRVASQNLNLSRQGVSGSIFLPDSPGLVGANYLGMPLLPGQSLQLGATSTGALSLSALVFCRPLTAAEQREVEALRATPPQARLLFGLGTATLAAGAAGVLTGIVDRATDELGYLVLDQDVTNPPADLQVTGITVAGQPVDAEAVAAPYFAAHRAHDAAFGRAVPLRACLSPGAEVRVNLVNTAAAPRTITGGFIRQPSSRQIDGSAAAPLRADRPGFGGGTPWGGADLVVPQLGDEVDDATAEMAVREWKAGRLQGADAVRVGALVKAVGALPAAERGERFKQGLRGLRRQGALTFLGGR